MDGIKPRFEFRAFALNFGIVEEEREYLIKHPYGKW